MKPVARIAALIAASLFLFACHSGADKVVTAGKVIRVSVHFKDDRARFAAMTGSDIPEKGKPDMVATTLIGHMKTRLKQQGFTLVDSDKKADAVVTYTLMAYASAITPDHFVRRIDMGLDLATTATMNGKTYSQKNRFHTEQKGINWTFWDTKTSQKRHALQALLKSVDKASTLDGFLVNNKS